MDERSELPALAFELPLPPSSNNTYTNAPGRGRALTSYAKSWKTAATVITRTAARASTWPIPPFSLSLFVYLPNEQRDLDNCIKLAQDAICEALGTDDRRVHELHAYRAIDKQRPRLVVVVRTIEP
jgi:Holliday junction resolvase RusA-like endonuclease